MNTAGAYCGLFLRALNKDVLDVVHSYLKHMDDLQEEDIEVLNLEKWRKTMLNKIYDHMSYEEKARIRLKYLFWVFYLYLHHDQDSKKPNAKNKKIELAMERFERCVYQKCDANGRLPFFEDAYETYYCRYG
jgi:hypothetical protein